MCNHACRMRRSVRTRLLRGRTASRRLGRPPASHSRPVRPIWLGWTVEPKAGRTPAEAHPTDQVVAHRSCDGVAHEVPTCPGCSAGLPHRPRKEYQRRSDEPPCHWRSLVAAHPAAHPPATVLAQLQPVCGKVPCSSRCRALTPADVSVGQPPRKAVVLWRTIDSIG